MKLNKFLEGIFSLIISQIFIKIFGVMYSLYLTNKTGFGDEGNAIYMSGYQIYALLLTISSIGVPNAISKLISEKRFIGDYKNEKRILKTSIIIFALIGFSCSVFVFTFSKYISKYIIEIPEAELSIKVLSPAIFFVSIISVMRGYFNGIGKIYITAKSQFYEQVVKSLLTIILVEIISRVSNYNTEIMSAVGNLATTVATFYSLLYIFYKYKKEKFEISREFYNERIVKIVKKLFLISIPITISSLIGNLGKNVDSITIVRILKNIIGEENSKIKYGILSSKVDILVALPLSFNIALSTALVPEISEKKVKNDIDGIIEKIIFSFKSTFLIGIPCAFGMFFYSERIFKLLFPNAIQGSELLSFSAIGIVFSLLTQTMNGIMQGLGKPKILLISSTVGLIVKIVSNIIFIPIENVYEKGAIIGNILSSIVSFVIVYNFLNKNIEIKTNLFRCIFKPLIASIFMIIISNYIYNFLIKLNFAITISIIISIIMAIFSYFVLIFLFNFKIFIQKHETLKLLKNKENKKSKF